MSKFAALIVLLIASCAAPTSTPAIETKCSTGSDCASGCCRSGTCAAADACAQPQPAPKPAPLVC